VKRSVPHINLHILPRSVGCCGYLKEPTDQHLDIECDISPFKIKSQPLTKTEAQPPSSGSGWAQGFGFLMNRNGNHHLDKFIVWPSPDSSFRPAQYQYIIHLDCFILFLFLCICIVICLLLKRPPIFQTLSASGLENKVGPSFSLRLI